jgi:hypothetical protein
VFIGGRIEAERSKAEIAIRQLRQQEQEVRNRIALAEMPKPGIDTKNF